MKTAVLALACATMVAGCQTYKPIAIDQAAFPAVLAQRRLEDHGRPWTAGDLLALALSQNPDVLAARAHRLSALRQAAASRTGPPAGLSLSGEYANNAGASPWLYGGALDLPADLGARRSTRLTLADLDRLQADLDYESAVWAVRSALAHALAARRATEASLALVQRLSDLRQRRVDLLETRVAAGEESRATVLQARTDLSAAHRRLADLLARRQEVNADLARVLGVSPSAVENLQTPSPSSTEPPPGPAADQASALRRPEILTALIAYDRAEAALRLEIARQFPDVRLGPGYAWDHGVVKLPFNLSLVLPPADLNRANIRVAEARRLEAASNLEAVQAQVLDQLGRARDGLGRSRLQLSLIQDRDLPAAQGLANAGRRALRAGETDQPDVLAAEGGLLEAELAKVEATSALEIAVSDLETALRTTFDPGDAQALNTEVHSGSHR